MKKLTPRPKGSAFVVAFAVLPEKLKQHINNKILAINNVEKKEGGNYSKQWNYDTITVIETNTTNLSASGDYSINYLSFFNLRDMQSIPMANKLKVSRHLYTGGMVKYWGLRDSYNMKPEGDEMKLAAGQFNVDIKRHEVLIHYVHTYDGNWLYIYIGRESPLKVYYGYETFSKMLLREYIGLALLVQDETNRNPNWILSDAWRHFFGDWSKNEITVEMLVSKGYLNFKKQGYPSITSRGESHLENLTDNAGLNSPMASVSEALRRDKIDWRDSLDKPMLKILEELYDLD